jgi:hypothetical protein
MKNLIFLFSIMAFCLLSCSKTKEVPSPSAEFILGTLTKGYSIGFVPFNDQNRLEISQLDTINTFCIKIYENNLDSSYFAGTKRIPVFAVNLVTTIDKENFLTGHNCRLGGWWGGGIIGSNECIIGGQIELKFKVSNHVVPFNDTLEVIDANDKIKITYASMYSKLSKIDSAIIVKD